MYNRKSFSLSVIDTTDFWSYTTATIRQANGTAGNKVELFIGLQDDEVNASLKHMVACRVNTGVANCGIGLDSTTAYTGICQSGQNINTSNVYIALGAELRQSLAIGYHYLAWCERGADGAGSICVFIGDNAGTGEQTGMYATVMA